MPIHDQGYRRYGGGKARGRGWTLWKSLITMVGALDEDDAEAIAVRRREIDVITADFAAER